VVEGSCKCIQNEIPPPANVRANEISFPCSSKNQSTSQQQQQPQQQPQLQLQLQQPQPQPQLQLQLQPQQQPQPQPQQRPTLSLFGGQNAAPLQHSQHSMTTGGLVVPGVQIDVSNLLPTTKFESCSEEVKKEIETIDASVLYQIQLCNEVSSILPLIADQGSTIPNDVEFVQGKLDTIQHALENDARDIDNVRQLVSRDAAEAQVAFRAIDNLKLPLQYQSTSGGWWSVPDQQLSERQSLRSTIGNRKRTLALPDDVEADPSTATSVNGVPVNLVDYFSQRSDEMRSVLDGYKRSLKDIEDHLHSIEITVNRQINEFVASRSRDGTAGSASMSKSQLGELADALGDVEAGIFSVASRLGGAKEQVQELVLGPVSLGSGRQG
jgi:nucleoporin p58/p45